MSERACQNCEFWYAPVNGQIGVEYRQCRRYPPSVRTPQHIKDDWGHTAFPATPSGAWCGEFQECSRDD